jgi:very-short-patch-repair endonuclease|tara:strand:+ start:8996 stop:9796 length:801 start_codon:yes stop_codon:yes gene_type:complete
MTQSKKSYKALSKAEKLKLIKELYVNQKQSFAQIAEEYDTYANKIRRDASVLGIKVRNKSQAQKNALAQGKHKHPTKGTKRSTETKSKIGKTVMQAWENTDEEEREKRRQKSKEIWNSMSDFKKQNMIKAANIAVRESSKEGSKLEKYILKELLNAGYKVDFHKEQSLVTTKLQIDLFLPTMNIAIEVDGPSHFLPVWGEEVLQRNISYDNKKTGLIIGKGLKLIRIKQINDFSNARASVICEKLCKLLLEIKQGQQTKNNYTIED